MSAAAMKSRHLLAIDQGTTSTRAILFDAKGRPRVSHALPLAQVYPANGWVEHDPLEIWSGVRACVKTVLKDVRGSEAAPEGTWAERPAFGVGAQEDEDGEA